MGNDNEFGFSFNEYVDFSITLEKICYLQGEKINGTIYLKGKNGLKETQLNDPKAIFTIFESQKYIFGSGRHTEKKKKKKK